MANNNNAKILYLLRILQEETDPKKGLSMPQIIERLQGLGIQAERKSIYRYIEALKEFGIDVKTYNRRPVEYAIDKRDFSLGQLMLLVDAVETCKFLTSRQSKELITNLKLMASDNQRKTLDRRIHVEGRILSKNDSVFDYIDLIHEAIRHKRKIEFHYFKYDASGKRYPTNQGKYHVVTPIGITYAEGFYYLSAWNDKHESIAEYRLDRMTDMRVSPENATKNDIIRNFKFDNSDYVYFGRFNGEKITATLSVDADKIGIIIDKFGNSAEIIKIDEEKAKAIVKIRKSSQFFGWIAGLDGSVKIDGPEKLRAEYKKYLQRLIASA